MTKREKIELKVIELFAKTELNKEELTKTLKDLADYYYQKGLDNGIKLSIETLKTAQIKYENSI